MTAALLLAGALAAAPPAVDLRVEAPAEAVVPGRAFPLTVVRAWSSDLRPEPWRDALLAPLVVREVSSVTRAEPGPGTEAARVVEERRFDAWVFSRGPVEVAPELAATGAEGVVHASAPRTWTIAVRPAVDAAAPGAPEPPGGLLPAAADGPGAVEVALAGAALLAAAALLVRSRRRRRRAGASSSIDVVRRALAALRARGPAGVTAAEVADAARTLLAVRCGLPANERTTEELLATAETACAVGAEARAQLESVLRAGDREKFAGRATAPDEAARLLDDAERLLAATTGGGES